MRSGDHEFAGSPSNFLRIVSILTMARRCPTNVAAKVRVFTLLGLVALVLAGCGVPGQVPGEGSPSREKWRRVVRIFNDSPWKVFCEDEGGTGHCNSAGLGRVPLRTPDWATDVRLVATVTVDARTSPGDAGAVGMTYEHSSFDEARRLKPHAWLVHSPSLRRGATFTFTGLLPAKGRRYDVIPKVNPRDRTGDREVVVTGRRVVVVLEATFRP